MTTPSLDDMDEDDEDEDDEEDDEEEEDEEDEEGMDDEEEGEAVNNDGVNGDGLSKVKGAIKLYTCEFAPCEKSFARRSDLVRHNRIHTNERYALCFPF